MVSYPLVCGLEWPVSIKYSSRKRGQTLRSVLMEAFSLYGGGCKSNQRGVRVHRWKIHLEFSLRVENKHINLLGLCWVSERRMCLREISDMMWKERKKNQNNLTVCRLHFS